MEEDNINIFKPLTYQGTTYPSKEGYIADGNGVIQKRTYFRGSDGQYYAIDNNGNAVPMHLNNPNGGDAITLQYADSYQGDGPVVTPSEETWNYLRDRNQELQGDRDFSHFDIDENGKRINLKNNVENHDLNVRRQALMRVAGYDVPDNGLWDDNQQAIWDKLTIKDKDYDTTLTGFGKAMMDKLTGNTTYRDNPLIQDAVQAYNPNIIDKAKSSVNRALNTTAGKAITGTWGPVIGASILPGIPAAYIDAGLTSYFGAKGLTNLVNGNENWETALDIAPLGRVGKSVYDVGKEYFNLGRSWFRRNPLSFYNTPKVTSEGVSVGSNAEDIANTANASQNNTNNIVIDQDALNSVENILANNNARLTASRRPQVAIRPTRSVAPTNTTINTSTSNTTNMGTTAREAVVQAAQGQNNTLNSIRSSYLNSSPHTTIKARDIKAGESPYTDEEVNVWINDKGELKDGFEFAPTSKVETGAHGEMYVPKIFPEQDETWILRQHLSNSSDNAKELKQIMQYNPSNRSGVLIETHNNDTSMDSTPLAYVLATRFAKRFKPLGDPTSRIRSNSYGYNNAFKQVKGINELNARAKAILDADPNYKAKLLRDDNGNMIAYELTDENGTFQIPLNTRQEVLDIINSKLHKFNDHYGTSYGDVTPYRNLNLERFDPDHPYPWDFGEEFDLPNMYGIAYKKGGKLKRRLLTSL